MRDDRLRPVGPSALGPLLLALLVALTLVGCTDGSGGSTDPEPEASGCGRCEAEVEQLRREVEALAGVAVVDQVRYNGEDVNAGSQVEITVEAQGRPVDELVDELTRLAWESELEPLAYASVNVLTQSGDFEQRGPFRFSGEDGDELRQRWGPRPVEQG